MLSGISISAIGFDNEPYFRALTATLMCTLSTKTTYLSTNEQEDNVEYIVSDNFYTEISSPYVKYVSSEDITTRAQFEAPDEYIIWTLPSNSYATLTAGDLYVPGPSALSSVGTLYIYFSGQTYDYKTNEIPFDTFNVQATLLDKYQVTAPPGPDDTAESLSSVEIAEYIQTYDLFPNIDFDLKLNNESTANSSLFYRLVSSTPFSGNVTFKSNDINFVQGASADNVVGWYTVNNSSTKYTSLSTAINTTFTRNTPQNHTVTAYISVAKLSADIEKGIGEQLTDTSELTADKYIVLENKFDKKITLLSVPVSSSLSKYPLTSYTPIGFSLPLLDNYNIYNYEQAYYVFYTPHILKRTLSAVFVNSFLKADFEGFPTLYLDDNNFVQTLSSGFDDDFRTDTHGLSFYGEGHTEHIMLTAYKDPDATNFIWNFYSNQEYTLLTENNGVTGELIVTSQPNIEAKIPISLQVTNSTFPSSAPLYYYDDVTGEQKTYPYFTTTVDLYGNELTTNTPLKQSITIKRYPDLEYYFVPGMTSPLLLPIDGGPQYFTSTFNLGLCGPVYVDPCFEKYNLSWKWSTFEKASISSFVGVPSSWATMESLGDFPKRWRYQPATFVRTIPTVCESSNLTWTLSTNLWKYTKYVYNGTSTLSFSASLSTDGSNLFTTSFTDDTDLTVAATRLATCVISAYPFDWLPREQTYTESYKTVAIAPPDLRLYTSNRYALLSTDVLFDNISRNLNFINLFTIDLDEGNVFTYTTPAEVPARFKINYKERGPKSVKITAKVSYSPLIVEEEFPNIITVIDQYEDVDPANYRSESTKLELPWPEQPRVFANDWVTEDNINICFKKFYENLQYLEDRSKLYDNTYIDYFGYLGIIPRPPAAFVCPINWTWEQLTCGVNTPSGTELITWTDVFSGADEITSGKYAKCGTWELQKRKDPPKNCNGKHCVEWKWSARRESNTTVPITWRQTRENNIYPKRWSYEPCEESPDVACDEGIWNVNIPKLDKYYNSIAVCETQDSKCNYNDVFSFDNTLYIAQQTQIKVLSSDFTATLVDFQRTFDGVTNYSNLKRVIVSKDRSRVYTLDENASVVSVYLYDYKKNFNKWRIFTTWGGYGGTKSKHKFNTPTDLHLDQDEDLWVSDSGNNAVKHYTNTGAWIKTITTDDLHTNKPISVAVDSQYGVHVLTQNTVFVYGHYTGELLFKYDISQYVTDTAVKIATSYNREILYIATKSQVLKFFRTGIFNGYVINETDCVTNITSVFHDEYRNLLVTTDDKVLKYADLMLKRSIKAELPSTYWQLNDLYIDKEEYVQNWVYNKSLQRLWDNIEIFRNSLYYEKTGCKTYNPPLYNKPDIIIGQNEIVTSTTINRVLEYLWKNFLTLLPFYDPDCRL